MKMNANALWRKRNIFAMEIVVLMIRGNAGIIAFYMLLIKENAYVANAIVQNHVNFKIVQEIAKKDVI